jgi:ribosomal protein S8E
MADFLPLSNTTNAITVVTGATKRNHTRKRRARFQCGQNGMLRSIGKEKRKTIKLRTAGRHQRSTDDEMLLGRLNAFDEIAIRNTYDDNPSVVTPHYA